MRTSVLQSRLSSSSLAWSPIRAAETERLISLWIRSTLISNLHTNCNSECKSIFDCGLRLIPRSMRETEAVKVGTRLTKWQVWRCSGLPLVPGGQGGPRFPGFGVGRRFAIWGPFPVRAPDSAPETCTSLNKILAWFKCSAVYGVAGVDARRATPPDPRLARWGLARCGQLDPSHPALLTREDPRVEPCLIPCTSSLSRSRLPAWPVLRSPLRERPGLPSGSDPEWGPLCMRDMLRNAPFSGFFQILGDQLFDASS